jgi:prepilin-type processing-associated H-X9-DG protein
MMLSGVKGRDSFRCPEARSAESGYAYNAALSSAMYDSLSDAALTVVIFESDKGWNASGGPELLTDMPRHLGGDNVGFADGHAAWLGRMRINPDDPKSGRRKEYPESYHVQWKP